MSKLLKLAILTLLIIIIGEFIYLFFTGKINKSSVSEVEELPENVITAPTSNTIHPDRWNALKNMSKNPNSKLQFITETSTTVLEIDTNGKKFKDKIIPVALLVDSGDAALPDYWLLLATPTVAKADVSIIKDGVKKPATLSDLVAGDKIKTKEVWDPSVPSLDENEVISFALEIYR